MKNLDKRDIGIDLARSLAIFGVVLVHSGGASFGRFGVQFFFLVSGYLLADLGKLSNREFLIKRGFRLFPLYLAVLTFLYLDRFESLWQLLVSIFLLQNLSWIFYSIPGAWSISNEWLYSLLLPLLRKINRNQLLLLLALSWFSQFVSSFIVYHQGGANPTDMSNTYEFKVWINTLNPFVNLAFFLIGIAMKRKFIPILSNKLIGYSILGLSQVVFFLSGHDFLFLLPPVLWALFSICIGYTSKNHKINLMISFVGQRTYGIFFIHFLVLNFVERLSLINRLPQNLEIRSGVVFTLTLFLSVVFSDISWRFIERPFINLSRGVKR